MILNKTVTTRLGDITKVRTGKLDANAQRPGGAYPFFTCGEETLAIDHYGFDTEAVLLAGNGNFNVKWYKGKFNAYQRTYIIEPKGVCGKWLFYAVQAALRKITSGHRGSVIRFIRLGDIVDSTVALPLPAEQERIVAEIEKQFTRLEVGVASLKRVQTALKRYRRSVLKAACESEDWQRVKLGDLVSSMKNGIYKPRTAYADDGIACLRMYNIDDGKIIWKNIKRMKLSKADVEEYRLSPGDLLVNRVNSRELVGKAAPIPEGLETCVFESKNIRVRLKRDIADPKFVGFAMSIYGQKHFNRNAQQVVGMASISQPQVAALEIPLPPLTEQTRLVPEVERKLSVIEDLEGLISANEQRAARLRQSILHQAFVG